MVKRFAQILAVLPLLALGTAGAPLAQRLPWPPERKDTLLWWHEVDIGR